MARGGIRLVHGHTKSTLITYFSGMKIDPNYAFLHAFFLICPSCPFQNLSIWPKTHPFFPILHVFAPLNAVRAYSACSWKNNPNYVNFWTSLIPPLTFEWPPRAGYLCRTNVNFGTLADGSLEINSLALNIVSAAETSSKMASNLCQKCF